MATTTTPGRGTPAKPLSTGFDVLGITRIGTNTCRPDPLLRRRLARHRFEELCAEAALQLAPWSRDYDHVVLRGQSTGAFPTLGIVRSRALPVTHLLVEDGINTRRSRHGAVRGPVAARLDWLRYARQESLGMRRPPGGLGRAGRPTVAAASRGFAVEQYSGSAVAQHIRPRRDPADRRRALVDLDDDAWHGFLVYAEYGAANLRAAKALRR